MILFMTSSPCDNQVPDGIHLPCIFDIRNHFVDNLRQHWKPDSRLLVICADPFDTERNDEMCETFSGCFLYHGLSLTSSVVLDSRNAENADLLVALSDVILLGGGHVPTQNTFFAEIGLQTLLRNYTGIVIGVSAGSMNCTDPVYAQPELPGESIDPNYRRFLPGLGLSRIQILPHYQMVRDSWLDGRRLFEDITYNDSFGHVFYAIPDSSYVLRTDETYTLFGEGYRIAEGQISRVCCEGERVSLHPDGSYSPSPLSAYSALQGD